MDTLDTFLSAPLPPNGVRVLLIEDNPADTRLFKEHLAEEKGQTYELIHVGTLEEALPWIEQETIDVIVLDLSLPDAQALEGLKQITDTAPHVPVVVHSGMNDRHLIEEAVRQGAQDYLVKGRYVADLLHRVIRYAIERQHALRIVQESEKRLRSIIEQTSDGVVIVNANGHVVFANPAAERLLGVPMDHLLGRPFGFDLDIRHTIELTINRTQKDIVTVDMRVTPIRWEGQYASLASLRDISAHKQLQTQLTRAKEEAEELAHLKSTFLANMSHELRTPLTGVMGFADTLLNELPNKQHRGFASLIKQAGERLLATINSVLDLSQLEAGTVKATKQHVNVTEIAQEVLPLLKPLAAKKGLTLELKTYTAQPVVHADKILLQRILDNLIGNAIKFTEKGSIVVTIDADVSNVHIYVKDTGKGIASSFMPHLFDQFSQESAGLRRSHPGSGLGLAITRKLVTLLDGTIQVESTIGVGSCFTILLPLATRSALSRPAPIKLERPPTANGQPALLVAEDHAEPGC